MHKKIVTYIVGAIIVIVAIIVFTGKKTNTPLATDIPSSQTSQDGSTSVSLPAQAGSESSPQQGQQSVSLPAKQSVNVNKQPIPVPTPALSKPDETIPLNGSGIIKIFNIAVTAHGFSPQQIVIRKGDTVQIAFQKPEATYDINSVLLGKFSVDKSQNGTTITKEATDTGLFPFACKDYCPISTPDLQGSIVVLP